MSTAGVRPSRVLILLLTILAGMSGGVGAVDATHATMTTVAAVTDGSLTSQAPQRATPTSPCDRGINTVAELLARNQMDEHGDATIVAEVTKVELDVTQATEGYSLADLVADDIGASTDGEASAESSAGINSVAELLARNQMDEGGDATVVAEVTEMELVVTQATEGYSLADLVADDVGVTCRDDQERNQEWLATSRGAT